MTAFLTIGGNELDDKVEIGSISCTHGRTDITSQPYPSTFKCRFQLNEGVTLPYEIALGSQIVWCVYDSSIGTGKRQVFFGTVSDLTVSLQWLNGSGIFVYEVTGVDYLATLGNKTYSSSLSKDYDGNRIDTVLSHYGYDTTDIETPGAYEIAVRSAAPGANALTICQEAANSAMGVLFCQPNSSGRIKYQSYLSRKSNTEITLTTSDIMASDFVLSTSTNTVANQVSLTYGTGSSGTVYNDTASQAIYGIRSGIRDTTLHNVTDANTIAQNILAARANPSFNLSSITVNTATISDALRTSMALVEVGTRISITGLPTAELESFKGYVEGYTWTTARGQDIIQMNLSNAAELYPFTLWSDLNLTDTWNTYATATTTWSDIT